MNIQQPSTPITTEMASMAERPRLPLDIERTVFETIARDHLQSGGTPGGLVNLRLVAFRVREWCVRLACMHVKQTRRDAFTLAIPRSPFLLIFFF